MVQALSDVPTESGKTFKALLLCKERFQEAECQDGSAFSLSPSPCLFIRFFSTFSIFIADVGRGSRPGAAAFRSVLIPADRRLQISPVFIFLDGGQQKPAAPVLCSEKSPSRQSGDERA